MLRGERSPAVTWTEQDGLLAVALTSYEASLCACGHPMSETMGEENDGAWTSEPFRCHACTENARRVEQLDKDGSKHLTAVRFAARRIDPGEVAAKWQKPARPAPSP